MTSDFELLARYNQRMDKSIYDAAATLSTDEIKKNRGAFFGSIIGTLNHILVGNIIWLKRLANHDTPLPSLDYVRAIETPASLDATLYSTLKPLAQESAKIDEVIVQFVSELTDQTLTMPLAYRNTKGQLFNKNFGHLLLHFFNHQTHHRGQVSTLLYQAGIDIGVTDLLIDIPNA